MAQRRQYKTGRNNRTTYIYYDAFGHKAAELIPGVDGVTSLDIELLHASDDAIYDTQRYEDTHAPVHLESYETFTDDGDGAEYNHFLMDYNSDPADLSEKEQQYDLIAKAFDEAWEQLTDSQKELIDLMYSGISYVEISRKYGVTETAIRNRRCKIHKYFLQVLELVHTAHDL